jgi:hypothetical protein
MNRYVLAFAAVLTALSISAAGQSAPKNPDIHGPTPARVSGTIVDQAKKPIAAVPVGIEAIGANAPGGAKLMTDSNGRYYTIVTRFNGKYRVTPVLKGYRFSPAFREVSGSGGEANFVGTRASGME